MPIGPIPQRDCFIVRVSVGLPEHSNGGVRYPTLQKHHAVEFAVPWDNSTDFDGARLWDLRDEYLSDPTFFIELGRYKGPPFNIAAEDRNHIRMSHRIGNDPEVGCPTQQRYPSKPDSGHDGDQQETYRN